MLELEEDLARINSNIAEMTKLFDSPVTKEQDGVYMHFLSSFHTVPGYDFAGRGQLPESYTRSAGFKCPACGKTVMRSKSGLAVGAGRREVAFSCHCTAALVEPKLAAQVTLKRWEDMRAHCPQEANTAIIVLDAHGILYGHQLARDVAEGRKPVQEVRFFRDVVFDAFCALLTVRFGDTPCVQALRAAGEITTEHLERISAELVLTSLRY